MNRMVLLKIINKLKIKKWKKNGLIVGNNFSMQKGVEIDSAFPWLVSIGSNVTLAPHSMILSHDGSTKKIVGYTKIGKVIIEDNVFVGANSIILPNTIIGKNSVIGANSVVSGKISANSVVCGSPAKVICTTGEFENKHKRNMKKAMIYDASYTRKGKITNDKKKQMVNDLNDGIGYIV